MYSYPISTHGAIEVANYAALPAVGESGVIYITIDTNKTYRWTGSVYALIGGGNNGIEIPILTSRDALITDANNINVSNQTSAVNLTVQQESVVAFEVGTVLTALQSNTGAFTFVAGSGVTFQGTAPTPSQYGSVSLRYRGGNVWVWDSGSSGSSGADEASNIVYDPITGRVTQTTNVTTGEAINYIYNTSGQLTSMTKVVSGVTLTKTFTYNTSGQVTAISLWV